MKFYDVEANSEQHQNLRLGVVTASQFSRILTPKKREVSKQARGYMFCKLAELMTDEPAEMEEWQAPWMERGIALEYEAVKSYEFNTDQTTERGGFFTNDEGTIGCSPDRLVGKPGLLEIKCPLMPRQVETALAMMLDTPEFIDDHVSQLQGQMYICEREWVDVYSYHPRLFLEPKRVMRDDAFIKDLDRALHEFIEMMMIAYHRLEQKYGPFPLPGIPAPVAQEIIGDLGVSLDDIPAIFAKAREQQEKQS